eukprot:352252-Chlamydomonas_euryale.AAC.2
MASNAKRSKQASRSSKRHEGRHGIHSGDGWLQLMEALVMARAPRGPHRCRAQCHLSPPKRSKRACAASNRDASRWGGGAILEGADVWLAAYRSEHIWACGMPSRKGRSKEYTSVHDQPRMCTYVYTIISPARARPARPQPTHTTRDAARAHDVSPRVAWLPILPTRTLALKSQRLQRGRAFQLSL